MPTKILLAKITVFSISLCSRYENAIEIILTIGRDIINPAKDGFFKESQLANDKIIAEIKTLKRKNTGKAIQKSFLFWKLGFLVARILYQ